MLNVDRVPHMGWNAVKNLQPGLPLLAGVESEPQFYFVHSYYVEPTDAGITWLTLLLLSVAVGNAFTVTVADCPETV